MLAAALIWLRVRDAAPPDAVYIPRHIENGRIVPEQRVLMKLMKEKFGADRSTQTYLYQLFPHGVLKQGNKIAGLPRPKGCS